jgi:hypothetical protein
VSSLSNEMNTARGAILLAIGLLIYGLHAIAFKHASWYGVPIAEGKESIAVGALCMLFSVLLVLVYIQSKRRRREGKSADDRHR